MISDSTAKKLISIVVPLHNESMNLPFLMDALAKATKLLPYTFEYVLVDDGSSDDSVAVVHALEKRYRAIRLLELSRNFGKEAAVSAGLHAAQGVAAVLMDADLQHPPALLKEFIAKWEAGAEVVVGVKHYSKDESYFKKACSEWYYRILKRISNTAITPHACDYRLLDRGVIDNFNRLTEHNRMSRGLIDWLGFKRDYIYFIAPLRENGVASYSLKKLIILAVNSFTSYSLLPLKLTGYMGTVILFLAGPAVAFVVIERFLLHDPLGLRISGTAILALLLLFLVGVVLASVGLVALYIAHIYEEVLNRPLYVLRKYPS